MGGGERERETERETETERQRESNRNRYNVFAKCVQLTVCSKSSPVVYFRNPSGGTRKNINERTCGKTR